jgi:hypothetical protein
MASLILCFLAIFGLVFLFKETDGPFNIFNFIRNRLMLNKYIGVFFYKLLLCYFCTGCHAGWIIYLLYIPILQWSWNILIIWVLAGGTVSFIIANVLELISLIKQYLEKQ